MDQVESTVRVSAHTDSYVNGDRPYMSATHTGALKVGQVDLPFAALAAGGYLYSISTAGGTAKAPVTSVGTTTAAFALWNGNAVATGVSLIVKAVHCFIVSGTPALGGSVMAGLSPSAQGSAVSAYAGVVGPKSMSASARRTSGAIVGGAITLAAAPVWTQIGSLPVTGSGDVGWGVTCPVNGAIVIPPQFACGFTVLAAAGTNPLFGWTWEYAEMVLPLQ